MLPENLEAPHFAVHPRLVQDTLFVVDLTLSRVLLMDDERFPWLILVPRIPAIQELFELKESSKTQLWTEITILSKLLKTMMSADKINIATLGNQVPQLHIHIIARYKQDEAWPAPVWGFSTPKPYPEKKAASLLEQLMKEIKIVSTPVSGLL